MGLKNEQLCLFDDAVLEELISEGGFISNLLSGLRYAAFIKAADEGRDLFGSSLCEPLADNAKSL